MTVRDFFFCDSDGKDVESRQDKEGGDSRPLALLRGQFMEVRKTRKGKTSDEWDAAFELLWPDYPRKVGKPAALRAWRAIKPQNQETFDAIDAGLSRWVSEWRGVDKRYIPHPATWLNQRRWEDEP